MKKLLLSIIAALAMTALLAPSARAEIVWINDANDSPQEDISAVKVTYGPKNLFVRVKYYGGSPDYWAYAWLDTKKADTGPEFVMTWDFMAPNRIDLRRVNNFQWGGGKERTCAAMDMTYEGGELLFKMPRGCLRIDKVTPTGLRVSVQSEDQGLPPDDWAPEYHKFSRWIQPG